MLSKKALATISLVIAISVTLVTPVFAADSDIYLLSDTSKPAFTKADTAHISTQRTIGLNSGNYGYEYNGKIYKFDDVSTLFNKDGKNFTQTMTDLPTAANSVHDVSTALSVSSISATSTSTVTVTFNNTVAATDEVALAYTFNGVAVPASNITYSGTTATLTGLTLVSSTDGKTPAYQLEVKSGTTELVNQSVVLKNSLIASVSAVPDVSVVQNAQPVLPRTVNVTYKDGSSAAVPVTWGSVITSTAGIKKVVGKISGTALTATINVNVTAIDYIDDSGISMVDYPTLGIYLVNVQVDSSVASLSLNGTTMYYEGNDTFQLSTVLTKGSTVTFNAYDATGKLLVSKPYTVQQ